MAAKQAGELPSGHELLEGLTSGEGWTEPEPLLQPRVVDDAPVDQELDLIEGEVDQAEATDGPGHRHGERGWDRQSEPAAHPPGLGEQEDPVPRHVEDAGVVLAGRA